MSLLRYGTFLAAWNKQPEAFEWILFTCVMIATFQEVALGVGSRVEDCPIWLVPTEMLESFTEDFLYVGKLSRMS